MCPQSLHAPAPSIAGPIQVPLLWLGAVMVVGIYMLSYVVNVRHHGAHSGRIAWLHFLSCASVLAGLLLLVGVIVPWSQSLAVWHGEVFVHLAAQGCPTAPATSAFNAATRVQEGLEVLAMLCVAVGGGLALIRTSMLRTRDVASGHGQE